MGYVLPILIALGSLALDDLDLGSGWRAPWAVPLLILVPYLVSRLEGRAGVAGKFRRSAALARLGQTLPVLLQFAAVGLFGWRLSLEEWLGGELSIFRWPRPAQLLVMAPYAFYAFAAIDAEARINSERGRVRSSLRKFQLRMLFAGLVPVIVYVLGASLVGRWGVVRVGVEEVGLWSAAFTGLVLLGFVLFLPLLLRYTWDTEKLEDSPQLELLQRVAGLAGFRCRELLVWRTGNLVANAAIVGLTPSSRRVFFSDALLRQLGPRQLAAVFAHEIGHARRHHVPLFLIWAIAFFAGLDTLAFRLDPDGSGWAFLVLGAGGLAWLLGFGWLSRRVELDADLYCLDLLQDGLGITSALQSTAAGRPGRAGWRHFSVVDRIEFLGRATADPEVGRGLRRKLRLGWALGLLMLVLAGGFQLTGLLEEYPEDRVRVELRLGRYLSARDRLAGVAEPDEDLVALVGFVAEAVGRDFDDPADAAKECSRRVPEAVEAGEARLAWTWLRLAGLAGDRAADRAAELLTPVVSDPGEETDPGDARELPEPEDLGPWREVLLPLLEQNPA